ncbi:MAG TPA: UbiD family decarboxylase, partial [Acidimicrobiales bacterium]|nr:UbiD family decarboxylase [Acidimicrobiales bacterium]
MAAINDLRGFIEALEADGQLARISRQVSIRHELADVGAALARTGTGAGLFENVDGSRWPIFCGGIASHRRTAIALGCQPNEIIDVMDSVLDQANGIAPVRIEQAAWQANRVSGDDLADFDLPIPTHSRGDGGAFI